MRSSSPATYRFIYFLTHIAQSAPHTFTHETSWRITKCCILYSVMWRAVWRTLYGDTLIGFEHFVTPYILLLSFVSWRIFVPNLVLSLLSSCWSIHLAKIIALSPAIFISCKYYQIYIHKGYELLVFYLILSLIIYPQVGHLYCVIKLGTLLSTFSS